MEQYIVEAVVTAIMTLVLWFFKRTLDKQDEQVKELREEVQTFQKNYLHKDDFRDFKQELRDMFSEIKTNIRDLMKNAGSNP